MAHAPTTVPFAVAGRPEGDVDVQQRAGAGEPQGLEVLDPLSAAAAAPAVRSISSSAFGRGEQRHVPADGLARRVAVQPLGGGVPVGDVAVEGLGEDRVLGGLHERGEFVDALLGGFAVADVADGGGDQQSVGGLQRAEADLDGELGAVLAQAVQFEPRTHGPHLAVVGVAVAGAGVLAAEPVRDQHLDGRPSSSSRR